MISISAKPKSLHKRRFLHKGRFLVLYDSLTPYGTIQRVEKYVNSIKAAQKIKPAVRGGRGAGEILAVIEDTSGASVPVFDLVMRWTNLERDTKNLNKLYKWEFITKRQSRQYAS